MPSHMLNEREEMFFFPFSCFSFNPSMSGFMSSYANVPLTLLTLQKHSLYTLSQGQKILSLQIMGQELGEGYEENVQYVPAL